MCNSKLTYFVSLDKCLNVLTIVESKYSRELRTLLKAIYTTRYYYITVPCLSIPYPL